MYRFLFPLLIVLSSLLATASPQAARAAEGYDNCNGTIASLPAVISTQGVWCVKQNLSMAASSGIAITITTNNVTIDCNGFTLSGTAGVTTTTGGINGANLANVTVRHCALTGFYYGIALTGASSSGHVIEDNRFDSNTVYGPDVQGDGSVIRHNLVINTGFSSGAAFAKGIVAHDSVDVLDNVVSGVSTASGTNGYTFGIQIYNDADGRVSGNIVRGLTPDGSGNPAAIVVSSSPNATIRDNDLEGNGGYGVSCDIGSNGIVRGNIIFGFTTPISVCSGDGSNYSSP
jgi:parallel beta-helix repeat protein